MADNKESFQESVMIRRAKIRLFGAVIILIILFVLSVFFLQDRTNINFKNPIKISFLDTNNEFVINEARTTAVRILSFENLNDEERLILTYKTCLGREPREKEKNLSLSYLTNYNETNEKLDAWSGLIHGLFACIDFRFLN